MEHQPEVPSEDLPTIPSNDLPTIPPDSYDLGNRPPVNSAIGGAFVSGADPHETQATSAGIRSRTGLLIAVTSLVVIIVLSIPIIVLTRTRSGDVDASADMTEDLGPRTSATDPPSTDPMPAESTAPGNTAPETTTTTTTTPSTTAVASPVPIRVVGASASRELPAATLSCTGGTVTYSARNLIDGDHDTGWGASSGDGSGEYVELDLGGPVRLTAIGVTAGYTRVGPRKDQGCADVSAFDLNRILTAVRYDFDDGTSVVHDLDPTNRIQMIDVDTVTASVRMTILGTSRPPGADSDTVVSELVLEGLP